MSITTPAQLEEKIYPLTTEEAEVIQAILNTWSVELSVGMSASIPSEHYDTLNETRVIYWLRKAGWSVERWKNKDGRGIKIRSGSAKITDVLNNLPY